MLFEAILKWGSTFGSFLSFFTILITNYKNIVISYIISQSFLQLPSFDMEVYK